MLFPTSRKRLGLPAEEPHVTNNHTPPFKQRLPGLSTVSTALVKYQVLLPVKGVGRFPRDSQVVRSEPGPREGASKKTKKQSQGRDLAGKWEPSSEHAQGAWSRALRLLIAGVRTLRRSAASSDAPGRANPQCANTRPAAAPRWLRRQAATYELRITDRRSRIADRGSRVADRGVESRVSNCGSPA